MRALDKPRRRAFRRTRRQVRRFCVVICEGTCARRLFTTRPRLGDVDDEIVAARTALIPWRGVLLTGAHRGAGLSGADPSADRRLPLHRPPATAAEFVDLMTRTPLLGLVSLDLIYSVNNVLVALIYLALSSCSGSGPVHGYHCRATGLSWHGDLPRLNPFRRDAAAGTGV